MSFPRRWISVEDTAEYLSLKPKTIYQLALTGKIPSAKIGRSRRIDLKALEKQLEAQVREEK